MVGVFGQVLGSVWGRGYSIRIGGWFCGGLLLSLHELYLVGSVSWREGNLESGSCGPRGKCKGQCEGECVSVRVIVRDSVRVMLETYAGK